MQSLERSPSITTQAFDTVEQAGVCCSTCTPIPFISAAGTVVVLVARLSHSIYDRMRGRNRDSVHAEPNDVRIEFDKPVDRANNSDRTAESDDSDKSSRRHVVIVLHQNSDDDITGVEITDTRD